MSRLPPTRVILGAIAAGVVIRLALLGSDSFWLDEANSVVIATSGSIGEVWAHADPRHPPLYYLVLRAALAMLGISEWAARVPSALSSCAVMVLVFVLGRRLRFSTETCVIAVALVAVSPVDLWQAREARMYEMAAAAGLVAAIGLTIDAWPGILLAAAGMAVALHLDYTMIPVAALLAGCWTARWYAASGFRRTRLGPAEGGHHGDWRAVGQLVVILLLTTVAVWPLRGQLRDLAALADGATVFTNVKRIVGDFHLTPGVVLGGLAVEVGVVAVVGVAALRRANLQVRRGAPGLKARPTHRYAWMMTALVVVVNVVFALPRFYAVKQVLVTVWPYVALVAAAVMSRPDTSMADRSVLTRHRPWMVGTLVASLLLSAASLTAHRADWRGVVRYLNEHAASDAVVVLDPSWNRIPYDFYAPRHSAVFSVPGSVGGARDIWLIAERFGQPPPSSPSESWLDAHARLVEAVPFARLELRRYQR